MSTHQFSTKDALPVEQALPGQPAMSPNSPANAAANLAKASAEVLALRQAQEARRNAVAKSQKD